MERPHLAHLAFLNSFLNYEQVVTYRYPGDFSLDPIRELLGKLGNPHTRYPTLHVAGTKGKGSTCALAASILKAQGFRVGLYTSPHLVDFRERIRIDGEPIPEQDLAAVVEKVKPFASQKLTFFEVTTACALLAFAQAEVDVAVIEVGLGGRLDATNVVSPAVCAITPISLDHTLKLGSTVGQIAWEKSGIIKPEVPVVVAPQPPEAEAVLIQAANQRKAPWHLVDRETDISSVRVGIQGTRFSIKTPLGSYEDLFLPLLGRHQLINAAVAVRMVELWADSNRLSAAGGQFPSRQSRRGRGKLEASVRDGLWQVCWPGRCELIPGVPPVFLDGAQNAASAKALRQTIEELFPHRKVTVVLGVSLEKDLPGIALQLGPLACLLILTRASVPRAEDPHKIAQAFHAWHPNPPTVNSVPEALELAYAKTHPEGLIVVTGSLFVVGEALEVLRTAFASKGA